MTLTGKESGSRADHDFSAIIHDCRDVLQAKIIHADKRLREETDATVHSSKRGCP